MSVWSSMDHTVGGKCTRPRGFMCPGCGIIFCKCTEMPFLLQWLWMQETAAGSMHPIKWKKDGNIIWNKDWSENWKQRDGRKDEENTNKDACWNKSYHHLIFPVCVVNGRKLQSAAVMHFIVFISWHYYDSYEYANSV